MTPVTFDELTKITASATKFARDLRELCERLDHSLHILPEMTPEPCANVRALAREASALSDRLSTMFENGVMQDWHARQQAEQPEQPQMPRAMPFSLPQRNQDAA